MASVALLRGQRVMSLATVCAVGFASGCGKPPLDGPARLSCSLSGAIISRPSAFSSSTTREEFRGVKRVFEVDESRGNLVEIRSGEYLVYKPVFMSDRITGTHSSSDVRDSGDLFTKYETVEFNRKDISVAAQGGLKFNGQDAVRQASRGICSVETALASENKL